jgi:predicted RNA-binding protein
MATAYLRQGSGNEVLLEEVACVEREGDAVLLKTLFGVQKRVTATISEIDFLNSTIILDQSKGERQ